MFGISAASAGGLREMSFPLKRSNTECKQTEAADGAGYQCTQRPNLSVCIIKVQRVMWKAAAFCC